MADRDRTHMEIMRLVEEFRRRGAISPDRAMTASELGLPLRFEKAMRGRLGRLGLFVEVYGKYYLDEERLRELRELYFDRSRHIKRGRRSFTRTLLMLPLGPIISAVIYFALLTTGIKPFLGSILVIFVVTSVAVSIARILYRKSPRKLWMMAKSELPDTLCRRSLGASWGQCPASV